MLPRPTDHVIIGLCPEPGRSQPRIRRLKRGIGKQRGGMFVALQLIACGHHIAAIAQHMNEAKLREHLGDEWQQIHRPRRFPAPL